MRRGRAKFASEAVWVYGLRIARAWPDLMPAGSLATPKEIAMAKGQKRKTKETRKPKAEKPKPPEQVKR
jgi:hypothetical protein